MGTTGQSITLANSIIGVGILAMPFCFQQCGVLLAALILISMGLISRLCCYFLLKSALIARRRNFEFLAFHVFGSAGKLAVELGIIGFLMGTCIAYFVVVGDLGPQIVSKMFNINQSDILRTSIMVIVSLVCVLPLGLLRNVDSLSNVSAATIGFYLCLVIKVIAEAATQLPSGEWHYKMELWKPSGVLQCVPIFSMALFCQTQLFEIFESLPSLSLEKMNVVTKNAINICTSVYFTLGLFGYIAFCSHQISGNILMSLSPTMASDVIKLGFVMSLAFSFPLIIFPCRASLYSLLYKKVHSSQHDNIINHSIPERSFRCITVGIVAAALCVSLLIPDIELVLGFVGSTIGVLVCMVFPTACFLNVTFKNTNERVLAKIVLVLGLIIMVLGTYANLQAAENKLDKYDERYITQERIDKIVEDFFEKRGEKVDEAVLKQIPKRDPINPEAHKPSNTIVKDSEVQPPNPVPPESNSNEIKKAEATNNINKINNDKLLNDVLLPEKVKEDEAVDKVSETHPKNLKTKLDEANLANGDTEKKVADKTDVKVNEEIKDEKINIKKQQQLIETMKQHGEEQKELMQEQKEIMAEIIKNKNEEKPVQPKVEPSVAAKIEPPNVPKDINKEQQLIDTLKQHGKEQKDILDEIIKTRKEFKKNKEVDSNEAKKIAVESIKQIANMAIKSIGGVTERPVVQDVGKNDERLEQLTNDAVQQIAKKAVETIEALKEIKENPEEAKQVAETEVKRELKPLEVLEQVIQEAQKPSPKQVVDYLNNKPTQDMQTNENIAMPEINKNNEDYQKNAKKHSHSPDEPQSYKEGEDAQVDENKLNQNMPIPLAIKALQETAKKNQENKEQNIEAAKNLPRQKREVVDCTKTISLDPADKTICKSLLSPKFYKPNDILPQVDLNKVLSRPLDSMHHIGRSLKNYDKSESERDKK